MDLFEKVGATITTKGQEAVDKVKEMAEIANLKSQIATCEEIVKKNYQEIGKLYYEQYAEQEDAPYEKQCSAIRNARRGIRELEQKIQEVKGI
ncbi:MAG: hypothetical protein NC081_00030 [Roseburia sp.]|nr:hypothetical protein [Roseburia sp.]